MCDDDHDPPPVPCPACEGQGFHVIEYDAGIDYRDGSIRTHAYKQDCTICDATGWTAARPATLEDLIDEAATEPPNSTPTG